MSSKLLLPFALCLFNSINLDVSYEVEARKHEMISLRGSSFANVEEAKREEAVNRDVSDGNLVAFPNVKRRKLKTREKVTRKYEKYLLNSVEAPKKKKKNKRIRKKKIAPRRFVKTTVAEANRDSNMSDSKEVVRGNPVDIIVHIKMNE